METPTSSPTSTVIPPVAASGDPSAARPDRSPGTPVHARLPPPTQDEMDVVRAMRRQLQGQVDWARVRASARPWVEAVRRTPAPFWALESLLREYPISSAEGLALMRLAEALLRVPDAQTAVALTADQLGRADFDAARGPADGPHRLFAGLSASAIALSKRLLPEDAAGGDPPGLWRRLGAQTVTAATVRAIQLLGRQFVLGRRIGEALDLAATQRREARAANDGALRFSYDMLGEGARSDADARRYLDAYADAIRAIAARREPSASGPTTADGISIKLSALHPRFEELQRERVFDELQPRVWRLVEDAARADINLTIDAEESERLEISLDLLDALLAQVARHHPGWRGFGLAIQAYQTRAADVVDAVVGMARAHGVRLMVRLVKGAYWDAEVKRAQELGLAGYPVFTRKAHTDLSYLACAARLLDHADVVYPQFATHNAGTIAALVQMAAHRHRAPGEAFELQRLHGMGSGIYRELGRSADAAVPVRVYAPVGEHRDLLAYLVRRLLENGANSSFVHQLADESLSADVLLASPLVDLPGEPSGPALAPPTALYGPGRPNARGIDVHDRHQAALLELARGEPLAAAPPLADAAVIDEVMRRLQAGQGRWDAAGAGVRIAALRRAADLLEERGPGFLGLLGREAGKTMADAVAEWREAIDFLRYYAAEAATLLAPRSLPGPTGEHNELRLRGRGVFVCISPWNFPLAIFTGQVAAALVTGNAVAAKPAEQTPVVAARMVALLHEAGVPADALALLHGPGETVGAGLVAHAATAGVCFTGSTPVARAINRSLAAKDGPIVPLIAETGGLNAMLVDSTALPEQVVDAVVQSAFRSAGQRCSALRLLCLHEDIAEPVLEMLRGAMAELRLGDPLLASTDIGPVIDDEAEAGLRRHIERLDREARCIGRGRPADGVPLPRLVAPVAYELARVEDLREEIFGPVLHVVRWGGAPEAVVDRINALGFGLTFGLQSRIDSRSQALATRSRAGNVYVNRNMIGAVVGVQPFGGEGLSGTGPKAGGPHYLPRFCAEQTVTVNTAAAGGNVELMTGHGRN